jgi:hypothetical protein
MVDTLPRGNPKPERFRCCGYCGSTAFEDSPAVGLSKDIFCRQCGAGYRVNVLHDGLYLIEQINPPTECSDHEQAS